MNEWLILHSSAKRDIYAKPTASREAAQLWGNERHWITRFREAGLIHPYLYSATRMYKSRFAEPVDAHIMQYPQLRRFAAGRGLRIDVPLRGTIAEELWLRNDDNRMTVSCYVTSKFKPTNFS